MSIEVLMLAAMKGAATAAGAYALKKITEWWDTKPPKTPRKKAATRAGARRPGRGRGITGPRLRAR